MSSDVTRVLWQYAGNTTNDYDGIVIKGDTLEYCPNLDKSANPNWIKDIDAFFKAHQNEIAIDLREKFYSKATGHTYVINTTPPKQAPQVQTNNLTPAESRAIHAITNFDEEPAPTAREIEKACAAAQLPPATTATILKLLNNHPILLKGFHRDHLPEGLAAFRKALPMLQELDKVEPLNLSLSHMKVDHLNGAFLAGQIGDMFGFGNGNIEATRNTNSLLGNVDKFFEELKNGQFSVSDDTLFMRLLGHTLNDLMQKTKAGEEVSLIEVVFAFQFALEKYNDTKQVDSDPIARVHGRGVFRNLGALQNKVSYQHLEGRFDVFTPKEPGINAGCGTAMYMMVLPLFLPVNQQDKIKQVAQHLGFITHYDPIGYMGGMATALLTSFGIENKPFGEWIPALSAHYASNKENEKTLEGPDQINNPEIQNKIETAKKAWKFYQDIAFKDGRFNFEEFPDAPEGQDKLRWQFAFILDPSTNKAKPYPWDEPHELRTARGGGWSGSSGHDAPIMSFHYLIMSLREIMGDSVNISECTPSQVKDVFSRLDPTKKKEVFENFLKRACLNEGDSDSTGAIAGFWFGLIVGHENIPEEFQAVKDRTPPYLPRPQFEEEALKASADNMAAAAVHGVVTVKDRTILKKLREADIGGETYIYQEVDRAKEGSGGKQFDVVKTLQLAVAKPLLDIMPNSTDLPLIFLDSGHLIIHIPNSVDENAIYSQKKGWFGNQKFSKSVEEKLHGHRSKNEMEGYRTVTIDKQDLPKALKALGLTDTEFVTLCQTLIE